MGRSLGIGVASLPLISVISIACAGRAQLASSPVAMTESAGTPPLAQSLFARDPAGQLTEDKIQTILGSPLELDLPARVGVLPVVEAEDWRGPGPDYDIAPRGSSRLAKELPSQDAFTLVTEMLPIPSGALGMEALREIAARYKLRYIVLYRENVRQKIRANPWAAGYISPSSARCFFPGSTLKLEGYVEASLLDVKTGLLLFTVRRQVSANERSNLWHRQDKLQTLQARLSADVAGKLANDVRRALFAYADATTLENDRLAGRPSPDPRASAVAGEPAPIP